ncbi:flocculation protein FLO11-like isoform X2 [Tribolium madens]|uniref:flocculation protein FLO11-like isoform X2 n=1 Tax=Tribolium madens TaxID=41895 RepID=UPI001CF75882|nr:flocculation protein FLO11-like isoform X2 [Tribolium madens]
MLRHGLIYIVTFMLICGEYNAINDEAMRPFDDKFLDEISENNLKPRESIDFLKQKCPRCSKKNGHNGKKDDLNISEKELANIGKIFIHHLAKGGRNRVETYDTPPKEKCDEENHEQYVDKDFVEYMQKIENITKEGQMLYDELRGPPSIKYDPDVQNSKNCCEKESLIDNSNTNQHQHSSDLKMHFYKFTPDKIDDRRAISLYPDRTQYYAIPQKYDYIAFLSNGDKLVDIPAIKLNVFSDYLKRGKRTKNFVPYFTTLYKKNADNKLQFEPSQRRFTHTPVLFFDTTSGAKRYNGRLAKRSSKSDISTNNYMHDADVLLNKVNFFLKLGDEENEIRQIAGHVFTKPKKQVKKEIQEKNGFKSWFEDDYYEEPRAKKESQNDQLETSSSKENFGLFLDFDSENDELKGAVTTTMRKLTTTASEKSAIDMSPIEIENMMKDVVAKIDLPPLARNDLEISRLGYPNNLLNSEASQLLKERNLVDDYVNSALLKDHNFFKSKINSDNNLEETKDAGPQIFDNFLISDNDMNANQSSTTENTTDSEATVKPGNISCAYLLDLFKNIEALKKTDPNFQKICPKLCELSHIGENSTTTQECLNKTEETSPSPTSTTTESTTMETPSVSSFSTTEISSSCHTTESTTQEEASFSLSPYNMTHEPPQKTSPFPTKIEETTSTLVKHSQSVSPQQSNDLLTLFRFTNKISRDVERVSTEHLPSTLKTPKITETLCLPTKIDETNTTEENISPLEEENDLLESFQLLNKTFQELESSFENLTSGNENTSSSVQIESSSAIIVPENLTTISELGTISTVSEVSENSSEIISTVPETKITETLSSSTTEIGVLTQEISSEISMNSVPEATVTTEAESTSQTSATNSETLSSTQETTQTTLVTEISTTTETTSEVTTTVATISLQSEKTTTLETSASMEIETILLRTSSAASLSELEKTIIPQTSSINSVEKQTFESRESSSTNSPTFKEQYAEEDFAHFTKPVPTSVLKMEGITTTEYSSSIATLETSASTETETIILTSKSASPPPKLEETLIPQTTLTELPTEKQMLEPKESSSTSGTNKEEYAEENLAHFTKPVPTSVLKIEEITTNEYSSSADEVAKISATPAEDVKLTSLAKILFPPYVHIPTYKTNEAEDNVPKETIPSLTYTTNELQQNSPTVYAPYGHIITSRTNQFQENTTTAIPPPFSLPPTYRTNGYPNNPTQIPSYKPTKVGEESPKFTPLPHSSKSLTKSSTLEDGSNEYINYRDEELSAILDLLGHDLGTSTIRTDNNNTCEGILGKIKRKVFTVKNLLLKSKNREKNNGKRRKKDVQLYSVPQFKKKRAPSVSKEERMKEVKRLGKILHWRNMEFIKKSAKKRKKRRK